jgi:hypothetical protein
MAKSKSASAQQKLWWADHYSGRISKAKGPDRMDTIAQPESGTAASKSAFVDKCIALDKYFQEQKLSTLEINIPKVGFVRDADQAISHVKQITETDAKAIILHPMKLQWGVREDSNGDRYFGRYLVQEISKPLNIRLPLNKNTGFSYKIKTKENVVISRLLVDLKSIEENITQLINEANRFYILYCFPVS